MESKLYVIGGGMDPGRDLTISGLEQMRCCDAVLVITGDFERSNDTLRRHGVKCPIEDLMPLYIDGALDHENYARISRRILAECRKRKSVAVLVNGHPVVGVSWWSQLKKELNALGGSIEFIEGITSITSVYTLLGRDPIEVGVTVVDANRLLLFRYNVSNELDLFILDICSTGTRKTHLSSPKRDNQWNELCDYCRSVFGGDHECALVFAPMNPDVTAEIDHLSINDLPGKIDDIRFGTSLFIPAVGPRQVSVPFLRGLLGLDS